MNIGDWVQRQYDTKRYRTGKPHLVESTIDGAAITNCGRRLEPHTDAQSPNRLVIVTPTDDEKCEQCR